MKQYILTLIKKGQQLSKKYNSYIEFAYSTEYDDYSLSEIEYINIGFDNPDFQPKIKTFYRIGCPKRRKDGSYAPSYNFAEDRPESGISVVTEKWLHSLKSVFFGSSDEDIQNKGVYAIEGFALPTTGGDDETLIIATGEAKKTMIRTRNGLLKAVKK